MSQSGLPVELLVDGDVAPLPAGVELTAFRIIQESLTNALKHGARAGVEVRVVYRDRELEVEVHDQGNGGSPRTSNREPGYGLVGIRERVSVFGGDLDARPLPGGGFTVRARLPLVESPT